MELLCSELRLQWADQQPQCRKQMLWSAGYLLSSRLLTTARC